MSSNRPHFIEKARTDKDETIRQAEARKQRSVADANAAKEQARQRAMQDRQNRVAAAQKGAAAQKAAADSKMAEAQAGQQQLNQRKAQYEKQLGANYDDALKRYGDAKVQSAAGARLSVHVVNAVPDTVYPQVWQKLSERGYRLTRFHGFEFKGQTLFDVIFEKNNGVAWASFHNLNAQQYQEQSNKYTAQKYRLAYVNSYVSRGQVCYAPVFVKDNGPLWVARHGLTTDAHQKLFNDLLKQGYRLANQSVVNYNGTIYFTVLYDKQNVGGWAARALLNSAQYQLESDSNLKLGRTLDYLNVINVNGQPSFSAIWNSARYKGWVARHNLDAKAMQAMFMELVGKGYKTKLICGYQNGAQMNYAAMWYN